MEEKVDSADETPKVVAEAEAMPPPTEPTKQQKVDIEKLEEQKLKSKFPGMPARPAGAGGGGHSAFLQKRLAKGQKYFDSGDYQMAKQKGRMGRNPMAMPILAQPPTGECHPTPDTVPARKTSIIQQPVHGLQPHPPPNVCPGQPLPNPALTKLSI